MLALMNELELSVVNLRQEKPLVLCLTNVVTMDFMANSLLALGAAPLMSEAEEEIEELVNISDAVNINLGTLHPAFCARIQKAVEAAAARKKPIIFDPVGAGASQLRTDTARMLLPYVNVIRGNASEILALGGEHSHTKGVETVDNVSTATDIANQLAQGNKIVIVSGPVDYITDGTQASYLPFGSPLMPLITGMGCTLTAVIAAFAALQNDFYKAALMATAYFGLCGQLAYTKTKEPGSYKARFVDSLHAPDWPLFKGLLLAANHSE
ncbi:hydroxyethylthiazole kinase [Legionella hackeliae]|uniref:Hydroxyethylthiazole kinase n=1 Tax=Legionella hackeliae TaxID=449 RepID=A0A0A8UPS9_LEGHA|nr:hydroxyethylthiazole kinase [Legionella hackeliae]KTD14858.1 hydroxyethylthiazole kinase [Legionella hackeliae]CEK09516.1 Hydroxyethylthiazole kinase [Legionella hackeliae]STX49423.1 hydroxyethylthiazole kinase [Legionella hackeliae]